MVRSHLAQDLASKTRYRNKKMEETVRRGRRRKPLLDGLKEKKEYLKSKEEALDRIARETRL